LEVWVQLLRVRVPLLRVWALLRLLAPRRLALLLRAPLLLAPLRLVQLLRVWAPLLRV
jgi:hypothetical protein